MLSQKNEELYIAAVKYIGSILVSEDRRIADKVIASDALEKVSNIMFSMRPASLKQCLWLLSNLAASGGPHSKAVVMSSAMERVLSLARSPNIDVRHEALWVICNCISCGGEEEGRALFLRNEGQCIAPMLEGLQGHKGREFRLLLGILDALKKLLDTDEHF